MAVITGASSGLGEVLARAAAARGYRVVVIARREEPLRAVADQLQRATAVAADVTQADQCAAAVAHLPRIDLLINNVGKSDRGRLLESDPAWINELFAVNVLSILNMTRAALPALRRSHGVVVNIGSLAGKVAPRFLGGYAAAKFAVSGVSQQLALELAEEGVHVMLVCPGPIRRHDAGTRYAEQLEGQDVPAAAAQPGGGAKIKGLDPGRLAAEILDAAEQRKVELIRPRKVRLLLAISALAPRLGNWILRRSTS